MTLPNPALIPRFPSEDDILLIESLEFSIRSEIEDILSFNALVEDDN